MKSVSFALFVLVLAGCMIQTAQGTCTDSVFGTVEDGETAYAACPTNQDGYQSALCTAGTYGEADVSHCTERSITIFSYGIDSASFIVGREISPISLLTDGSISTYSILPELPSGLSFETSTGVISGNPTEASEAQAYTVSSTLTAGGDGPTTTITISVSVVMCPALDTFPTVADGETSSSSEACPDGTEGTATRLCTNGFFGNIDTSGCSALAPQNLNYAGTLSVRRNEPLVLTPSYTNEVSSFAVTTGSLPSGVTISSTTGTISGVPTVTGTYTITVTATGNGSTTRSLTISVTAASCSGLQDANGDPVTILNNNQIFFSCDEGYTGQWTYTCLDGVYQNKVTAGCIASRPTEFSYSRNSVILMTGEELYSGRPTFKGVAHVFQATSLPDGFTLDTSTGVITGSSDTAMSQTQLTIYAQADESVSSSQRASTDFFIEVREPTCAMTEEYPETSVNSYATYTCPDGYDGEMRRRCVLQNGVAQWGLPEAHCQVKQDYTFFTICVIVLVVCLLFMIIGFIVKCARKRSKEQKKNLTKTPSKPVPKSTSKPTSKSTAKAPQPVHKAPTKVTI